MATPNSKRNIGIESIQFPSAYSIPSRACASKAALWKSALTVGRQSWYHQGKSIAAKGGVWEAINRISIVGANLDFTDRTSLKHSDTFNSKDPTEKGIVSYHLGMIFTKLFAERYLNIPWLVHYSTLDADNRVTAHAGSTPDLLGYNAQNNEWNSFEAKGRNETYRSKVLEGAKTQAEQSVTVDGRACIMTVGAGLFRKANSELDFRWKDPEPKSEEPINYSTTISTWKNYYKVVFELYDLSEANPERFQTLFNFTLSLSRELLKFREFLDSSKEIAAKSKDIEFMLESIQKQSLNDDNVVYSKAPYVGLDGITISENL